LNDGAVTLPHDDAPVGLLDHATLAAGLNALPAPLLHILEAKSAAVTWAALLANPRRTAKARPDAWLRALVLFLKAAGLIRPLRFRASARIAAAVRRLAEALCRRSFDFFRSSACGRRLAFESALHRTVATLNGALLRRLIVILARSGILALEGSLWRPPATFIRALHGRLALNRAPL
jgi:hypothetical protein